MRILLFVFASSLLHAWNPTCKPEAKIETVMFENGGLITSKYQLIGRASKRLIHTFEIFAVWTNSSTKGAIKGIRIQVISTEPKNAGEIWVDFDEVKDLEAALKTTLDGEEEAFWVGRGGGRIGRVKMVGAPEPLLQRDSRSDSWIRLDKEVFTKLLELVTNAREALSK